nr:uncharacterized protein LOC114925163 [Arachis hypogaea]
MGRVFITSDHGRWNPSPSLSLSLSSTEPQQPFSLPANSSSQRPVPSAAVADEVFSSASVQTRRRRSSSPGSLLLASPGLLGAAVGVAASVLIVVGHPEVVSLSSSSSPPLSRVRVSSLCLRSPLCPSSLSFLPCRNFSSSLAARSFIPNNSPSSPTGNTFSFHGDASPRICRRCALSRRPPSIPASALFPICHSHQCRTYFDAIQMFLKDYSSVKKFSIPTPTFHEFCEEFYWSVKNRGMANSGTDLAGS